MLDIYQVKSEYKSWTMPDMEPITQNFNIEIRNNTYPYLEENVKDKIFLTDSVWNSYQIPRIIDTELSEVRISLVSGYLDFVNLESEMLQGEDYETYTIRFYPQVKDLGFYYLRLKLDEVNSGFDTEFDVTVIVQEEELFPTITNLTIEGHLVVRFNHEIMIPEDIDVIEEEGLNIWVEGPLGSSTEGGSSPYNLDWRIDELNSTSLVIKLLFDNPSTVGLSRKDKIFLQILSNEKFIASEFNLTMQEMTEPLEYDLELIMDPENFYVQWVLAYDLI